MFFDRNRLRPAADCPAGCPPSGRLRAIAAWRPCYGCNLAPDARPRPRADRESAAAADTWQLKMLHRPSTIRSTWSATFSPSAVGLTQVQPVTVTTRSAAVSRPSRLIRLLLAQRRAPECGPPRPGVGPPDDSHPPVPTRRAPRQTDLPDSSLRPSAPRSPPR
jgi:hypothetical protein